MRWALLAVLLSGCTAYKMEQVRAASSLPLNCPPNVIEASEHYRFWEASGCGRRAQCDTEGGTWVCRQVAAEVVAPAAPPASLLVVERLAVETGCPAASIAVTAASAGAHRLTACGKAYVCFVDLVAHVDCKRALEETAGH